MTTKFYPKSLISAFRFPSMNSGVTTCKGSLNQACSRPEIPFCKLELEHGELNFFETQICTTSLWMPALTGTWNVAFVETSHVHQTSDKLKELHFHC